MYGKIENDNLKIAPNPLWIGKIMIANPTNEQYEQNGYKPIVTSPAPQKDGYYYLPKYIDNGNEILQS